MTNVTVHRFDYTGEAYDACQCDGSINDGDILLVEAEQVLGFAGCWPVALTVSSGYLHSAKEGRLREYLTDQNMGANLEAACELADELGWPVVAELAR